MLRNGLWIGAEGTIGQLVSIVPLFSEPKI